jgi:hypothetical protein
MTLTIGIPSRGVNHSLHRVIEHAISLDVDEILVGINPGGEEVDNLSRYVDPRLKITFHEKDLDCMAISDFLLIKRILFSFLGFALMTSHHQMSLIC